MPCLRHFCKRIFIPFERSKQKAPTPVGIGAFQHHEMNSFHVLQNLTSPLPISSVASLPLQPESQTLLSPRWGIYEWYIHLQFAYFCSYHRRASHVWHSKWWKGDKHRFFLMATVILYPMSFFNLNLSYLNSIPLSPKIGFETYWLLQKYTTLIFALLLTWLW